MHNFAHTGKENASRIVTKFRMLVDVRNEITWATFRDNRLWGLGVARVRIPLSPLTRAAVRVCDIILDI